MLSNVQNNQVAFASKIRMSHQTAKALHSQPKNIKNALKEELNILSKNGRDDIVNISYKEQVSRSIRPSYFQVGDAKVIEMEVVEKRGMEYYSANARKIIKYFEEGFNEPLKIMDLYRSAKEQMQPFEKVSNSFMEYV